MNDDGIYTVRALERAIGRRIDIYEGLNLAASLAVRYYDSLRIEFKEPGVRRLMSESPELDAQILSILTDMRLDDIS